MEEYLNNLKNKFNYSEELINFLADLIPAMINYYGKEYENTILSALFNCEIHFQAKEEDPQEYLNSYFGVNKEWDMPELGGAFYHNQIFVKDNKVSAKPIIYLKTVYYRQYFPFDFQDDKKVNTLVHEICHLIKGFNKLKVENGKIIDSTGLMKDTYSYTLENGVQEESHDRIGIEEAINEVDTIWIMEIMTGKEQEIDGYKRAGTMATWLLEHEDIAQVIKSSQFNDDENWIQYLGEENAKMLIENFDILVKAMYVSYSEINTDEKLDALFSKMDKAEDNIYDFAQNYCSKEAKENFNNSLEIADHKTAEIIESTLKVVREEYMLEQRGSRL